MIRIASTLKRFYHGAHRRLDLLQRRKVASAGGHLLLDPPHSTSPEPAAPAPVDDPSAQSDNETVSKYWAEAFKLQRERDAIANPCNFWDDRILANHICHSITDTPMWWLSWYLTEYLRDVPSLGRVLSMGCGDGTHELAMVQAKDVRFLRAFDISEDLARVATERFEQAGIPHGRYLFEARDANNLDIEGTFDLILCAASLHHVSNLEDLLAKVRSMLAPGGYFAFLEYVGPNRFQWTPDQRSLVNGVLDALDPHYVNGEIARPFVGPTLEDMIQMDPSEAVRASDIRRLVKERFRVEYERNFYGTILHPLFPLLNRSLSNRNNGDFDSIIRLIAYFEKLLIDRNVLGSDFVFMVCRAPE